MGKTYKCGWSHCKMDNIIQEGDDFEIVGGKKYHKYCNFERENINKSIILFTEQINALISISRLRGVINTLIFKNGFDSAYIVFAIKYAIEHPEYKLTYPEGLYRICKDQKIIGLWKTQKANSLLQGQKVVIDQIDETEKIKYNSAQKKKSVSDLFS